MKNWMRGGIIGFIIGLVFIFYYIIRLKVQTGHNLCSFGTNACGFSIFIIVYQIAIWFIAGAIIGWIIGLILKKAQK